MRHHHWHSRRRSGCWDFAPAYAWASSGSESESDSEPRGAEFYFSVGRDDDGFGGPDADVPEAHHVIADHADLPAVLQLS